jgi:pyrroline-5-carboxylate reductase
VITVGFIGTGHLAAFLVEGLYRADATYSIIVSPRSTERAARLASQYGVVVAETNQHVVNRSDLIVVCVLPKNAKEILSDLRFHEDQLVISVMAAVRHELIAELVVPARAAVAMMPGHANALRLGPSVLYPPDRAAQEFLSYFGPVHSYNDVMTFAAASTFGGYSGMSFGWMADAIEWFTRHGLDSSDARRLVAETLKGNAEVLLSSEAALDSLIGAIATKDGITELGNRIINDQGYRAVWQAALNAIHARITNSAAGD